MPLIHFRNILSCSSEDRIHCAENLLKPEQYKKWLSSKGSDELITCIIELEKSTYISSVDIGNDGSAFIEIFVSRSSSSKPDDWTVLLPATLLMTPNDSRSNTNRNQVKLLKDTDLNKTCSNEKWDRLKIVCEQKFNRLNPFGLCFVKLYSPSSSEDEGNPNLASNRSSIRIRDEDEDETGQEQSKIGSFFAKKQAEKNLKVTEPTASSEIRALSNVADELLSRKPMNDTEIQSLLKKDVKNTPTRSSKRRISDEIETTPSKNEHKRNKTLDKSQLMNSVVFVLSGFQNPLRSDLRSKATEMGATYSDDWDRKCTHLICAFPNTPKATQVKQTGKGFIVNKQWILDCHKQSQLLAEKDYELKGSSNDQSREKRETPSRRSQKTSRTFDDDDDDEEEEENQEPLITKDVTRKPVMKKKMMTFDDEDEEDEDEEPVVTKRPQQKTPTKTKMIVSDDDAYNAETDEDEPLSSKKTTELPNFFQDKHFYVYDGDFDDATLHDIRRVIYAYDGILDQQLTSNIHYIITNRLWNRDFTNVSKTNANVKFLSLDWLQDCHDENKLVSYQPYAIAP